MYLLLFFIVVVVVVTLIKHNDQGNLKKRDFILVYGSREGVRSAAANMVAGAESCEVISYPQHKPGRELEVG